MIKCKTDTCFAFFLDLFEKIAYNQLKINERSAIDMFGKDKYVPKSTNELVYHSKVTAQDIWPKVFAFFVYAASFVLWMYLDKAYYNFGSKIITPLTAAMYVVGAVFAILLPSQRKETTNHTKWFVLGYLAIMFVYKFVIAAIGGVSSDSLAAAFNQSLPVTTGTAIAGWLQNLLWIIAITYPIGFFTMQAKKIPQFIKARNKNQAIRQIRDIRDNTKPY